MEADLQRCLSFIQCQLQPARKAALANGGERWRAVTISRQTGSGAHAVAELLAERLQAGPPKQAAWTVFDRNLVERVLEDHRLPARLAKFMPEDRKSRLDDIMDELFGLHPPTETLVHKTSETILRLADLGHVILIGRGANVITAKLEYVFHVRLVGSLEKRVEQIQDVRKVTKKAALKFARAEDRGRHRYLKKYFQQEIEDPLLYHLVINTDLVSYSDSARLIADALAGR
jgi:cytidylate kinase